MTRCKFAAKSKLPIEFGDFEICAFDEGILKKYSSAKWFITIEDGSLIGGIGSTIANWVTKQNFKIQVKCFGIPDKFIEHMSREEMIKEAKLDYESITKELDKIF